jgi:hypothetical protein
MMRAILFTGESIVNHFFFIQGIPENPPLPGLILDSAVETQWDMRTKIALTIQLLIHGDFNCAAVETGESRKMSRCSRPQPTITFSATESFHNQLRNPG